MSQTTDVIIVGGGAAGLTAALFASRRGLQTLVISQDIGGQAATTAKIENYPGIDHIDGLALMKNMQRQAERDGARVVIDEVYAIEKNSQGFQVQARNQEYQSTAVLLAHGLSHRHLDVPGEDQLIGKGVSYCASCDATKFHQQRVAVVGGGNSAMDAALLLAADNQVTLLTHHTELRGERVLIERTLAEAKVTVALGAKTLSVEGKTAVEGLTYEQAGAKHSIDVSGVFVEIGYVVHSKLAEHLAAHDARRQVIVDPQTNATNIPGLYAAGDVTTIAQKQIVISAGEGAKAALGLYTYFQSLGRLGRGGVVDWGVTTPFRHQQPTNS